MEGLKFAQASRSPPLISAPFRRRHRCPLPTSCFLLYPSSGTARFISYSNSKSKDSRKSTCTGTFWEGDVLVNHPTDGIISAADSKSFTLSQKFRTSTMGSKLHRTSKFSLCCFIGALLPCSTEMTALAVVNDPLGCTSTCIPSYPESSYHDLSRFLQSLVIADLDPTTAKWAITITGPFLSALGFLFILRIVMSWYPKLPVKQFPYIVAYAPTEPLLSVTRKLIPPLGGVDVTPVVWFGLVSFLNEILVGPQGLLVLLSQQV